MSLANLITMPRWTARAQFPPSRVMADDVTTPVFTCDNGLYLMANRNFGDGDPVWGVGWAESDHWARRVWGNPSGTGDLDDIPPAQWPLPSLVDIGRPESLSYGSVLAFEQSLPGARAGLAANGNYRVTDGGFLSAELRGIGGLIRHYFGTNEPMQSTLPVAIEFRLSDSV